MSAEIYVIGGGAWGTALAQAAASAGHQVALVVRSGAQADEINGMRQNTRYLGAQQLSDQILAQLDFAGLEAAKLVLMVTPAQTTRQVISAIGGEKLAGKSVVLCAKGLEATTLERQSEILGELAPDARAMVLSGPSFAADVAAGRPTAVTLAGSDRAATEAAAALLASKSFRPYMADDVVGVELAGGLKNIYALACGAVEGAGLGFSARSALIARAYAEMSRLVVALGGQAVTLTGLAGLGDLTLSCTTAQSRNYWFGSALGSGRSVAEIEASGAKLAEGVKTAPAALALAQRTGVDVPLIAAVNMLLAGKVNIDEIVDGLMSRPLKREGDF